MSILLKHIFRNIRENKGRSILILLALLISSAVLIINITLPSELYLKIEELYRNGYGDYDITIIQKESKLFNIEDLDIDDIEYSYIGKNSLAISNTDENLIISGIDIERAKKTGLLDSNMSSLANNEIVVNEIQAKEKGYKIGDIVEIEYDNKIYKLTIKDIVDSKGLLSSTWGAIYFYTTLDTVYNVKDIDKVYDLLYVDVKDDDKIDEFANYLSEHNDEYVIDKIIDKEAINEEISFVRYIMILIFAMSTITIYFVIGSLNKIILSERIPVIGTFRSIGASKGNMNLILLLENIVYGLIGGLLGSIFGILLTDTVSNIFVSYSSVNSVNMSPILIIIGIVFSTILQISICIKEIIRTNNKPIKDIIFNTQNTRYKIRKVRTIIGIILIILSFALYVLNTKTNILITMVVLVSFLIGLANIVPLLLQLVAKALFFIFKKIGWSTGIISSKNIGYNKMIISSTRLIVISLSLMLAIVITSTSITKLFTSFRYVTSDYDLILYGVSNEREKYDKLVELDGIESVEYLNYIYDDNITYNDGKKFSETPIIYSYEDESKYVQEINYDINDLEYYQILVDEKYAEKNDIKIGDTIKIKYGNLEEFEYKVVGYVNSTYFTTSRNVIVVNIEHFLTDITDIPIQIHLKCSNNINLEDMRKKVKDEVNEVGTEIVTTEEYIKNQEEDTDSIMSIFYVILGLSVLLSFIGIVNNQIIGFMQRKKELAVLNSTCMSRSQIKKMLLVETSIANLFACLLSILVGYLSIGVLDNFLQGMSLYIEMSFDLKVILMFVGIVYLVLLFTLLIPIIKLRKMNIVSEIKYE